MRLTPESLNALRTSRGGFLAETIATLGDDMTIKGWRTRLLSRDIPESAYLAAKARLFCGRTRCIQNGEAPGQSLMTLT